MGGARIDGSLWTVDGFRVHENPLPESVTTTGQGMQQQHTLERSMRRALQLAANGPAEGVNPRVGCVILSPAGEIIAEGWHRGAGTCHAEIGRAHVCTPVT